MKYNSGDRVENSSLFVEGIYYNKVICRCQSCLRSSVYTEDELNNGLVMCKVCEGVRQASTLIKPTTEMKTAITLIKNYNVGKYRTGANSVTPSQSYKGLNRGQQIGELILEFFVAKAKRNGGSSGISFDTPSSAILVCPSCRYYRRVIEIDKLNEYVKTNEGLDLQCPHCNKIIKKAEAEVKELRKNKTEHLQKIVTNRNNKKANKVREDGTSQLIQKVRSPLDNVKQGGKLDNLLKKVKELNKNLEIQDVEPSGASYKVLCTCNKCGTEVVIPSTRKNKEVGCPGCEKLKTDINYIGAYSKDYKGTAKNLLELIERKDDICTVKCNSCGRVYNNIKFYNWYKGKVICNCENNQLTNEVICSNCGEYMTIPLKSVIGKNDNTKHIICSKCGKDSGVTIQEIIDDYIEAPSMAITTSNKLGVARNKIKSSTTIVNGVVIKSKEPLYIGTDGNMYYKCTCMEHNTDMIMNDDEISTFDHSQCNDARQHIMKDITKDNIKF